MKKIAVITPVYNGEKFITDCLESVALCIIGTEFVIEHIIVDDASTDTSWQIIQKHLFSHVKTFRLEKNSGSSTARNFGAKQTDADYLFFLDMDDVILQHSLKALYEFSRKQKSSWVYGNFLRTDEHLSYLIGQDYYGSQFSSAGNLLTSIFLGEHFFQQNCFYEKHIFDGLGGFDSRIEIYQDLDLCIRFALAGYCPQYLSNTLYLHRFHENNLSKLNGQENNPDLHKEDLKTLYKRYSFELNKVLNPQQLLRIHTYLST